MADSTRFIIILVGLMLAAVVIARVYLVFEDRRYVKISKKWQQRFLDVTYEIEQHKGEPRP